VRLDHFFYNSARTARQCGTKELPFAGYLIVLPAKAGSYSDTVASAFRRKSHSSLTLSGTIDDAPCRYRAGDAVKPQADTFTLREATRPAGHFPGGHRRGVTPVPIPNTEVKLSTADGTAWVTVWESRSLPGLFLQGPLLVSGLFFCTESISSQQSAGNKAITQTKTS
jgi:hypothetical protein